jgi:hypothetical protein
MVHVLERWNKKRTNSPWSQALIAGDHDASSRQSGSTSTSRSLSISKPLIWCSLSTGSSVTGSGAGTPAEADRFEEAPEGYEGFGQP